jgi:hypothetical protein
VRNVPAQGAHRGVILLLKKVIPHLIDRAGLVLQETTQRIDGGMFRHYVARVIV